jgi:hypothetical protein
MGALTSHNPMGLHGLLQGYLYLLQYIVFGDTCDMNDKLGNMLKEVRKIMTNLR